MGRRILVLLVLIALLAGCKQKKKKISLTGEDPVESRDFIEYFLPLTIPAYWTDSVFMKKEKDSSLINNKLFARFAPDSILYKVFGRGINPKLYPVGRVAVPKAETYLFIKAIASDKKAIYILAFDNKDQYITGIPLLWPPRGSANTQSLVIDRKFVITRAVSKKNPDGSSSEGKDVYVLNADAKNFMLIMTDALEDRPTELINPIDTLPKKNKIAGDYTSGKMNLVSIRDGTRPDRVRFFIHVDKNNGECTGEIRGEAKLKTANLAEYRQDGDPCILEFRFSSNSVSLKEAGCGSYRSLRCLFDGNFPRKKSPVQSLRKK
jgi:hypothetical protein